MLWIGNKYRFGFLFIYNAETFYDAYTYLV